MIGARRIRFAVLRPAPSPDGQGGAARAFAADGGVWGAIQTMTVGPEAAHDAIEQARRVGIVIEARPEITQGWRLVGAGRTFEVLARGGFAPPSRRARLICMEAPR